LLTNQEGTLGTAILSGVLASLSQINSEISSNHDDTPLPKVIPNKFVACVRSSKSASRIQNDLSAYSSQITVLENENEHGVQLADVVILGCKPYMVKDVITPAVAKQLENKILISILAGVKEDAIVQRIAEATNSTVEKVNCRVIRAMPSTAAFVRQSMTVLSIPSPPLAVASQTLVTWIFSRVGKVVSLQPHLMDAATALCGSGPAFCATVLESLADGAVAMGIPRADANMMAAQTMSGAAGLVLGGEHPAILREKVSTPGGCTIAGLLVLEEGGVRHSVSKAVREATTVASLLGTGVQNVNGTKH
jgi:pyrroline-5-carboxylate reductase